MDIFSWPHGLFRGNDWFSVGPHRLARWSVMLKRHATIGPVRRLESGRIVRKTPPCSGWEVVIRLGALIGPNERANCRVNVRMSPKIEQWEMPKVMEAPLADVAIHRMMGGHYSTGKPRLASYIKF